MAWRWHLGFNQYWGIACDRLCLQSLVPPSKPACPHCTMHPWVVAQAQVLSTGRWCFMALQLGEDALPAMWNMMIMVPHQTTAVYSWPELTGSMNTEHFSRSAYLAKAALESQEPNTQGITSTFCESPLFSIQIESSSCIFTDLLDMVFVRGQQAVYHTVLGETPLPVSAGHPVELLEGNRHM